MKNRILLLLGLTIGMSALSFADGLFKIQAAGNLVQSAVNLTIHNDTAIAYPNHNVFLRGLSVSGTIIKNSPDYVVRVILKDSDGLSHLVMESFEELYADDTIRIIGHAEETSLLNCIKGDSLFVYINNATFKLDSINSITTAIQRKMMPAAYNSRMETIREHLALAKMDMINEYNEENDKLWRAGLTDLSKKNDKLKRKILRIPENISTGGLEYYIGGIFDMGLESASASSTGETNKFVEGFDWRNRHNKNWMTPIKWQQDSPYCEAFAIVAGTESLMKLYYNDRTIDLDLSEQELATCCRRIREEDDPFETAVYGPFAMDYMVNHGICDEESYPFVNTGGQICISDNIIPNEQIRISGSTTIHCDSIDSIKHYLMTKGPLVSGYRHHSTNVRGHAMLLIGFGKVQAGKTIWIHDGSGYSYSVDIREGNPNIGKTYWIFKNSALNDGQGGYDDSLGYLCMLFNGGGYLDFCETEDFPYYSMNYTDSDILCEDADGDGYYFWGIGPKPAHAPNGIPDEPDGDDASADYGPMNKYGYLKVLNPSVATTIMVNDSVTVADTEYLYNHIQVNNNGVLTVETDTEFWGELKLTVKSGGTFIVDGIIIDNVELSLESGSHLIVKNGGTLKLRSGKSFNAPTGAIVDIMEGVIN